MEDAEAKGKHEWRHAAMCAQKIKNAPLVEAIVELQWDPQPGDDSKSAALNYSLWLGRLMDLLRDEYPAHKALPNAEAPTQFASQLHMVQHQFRVSDDAWPLVQVGPTVFTVNQTEGYDWEKDFRDRAIRAVKILSEAHQRLGPMQPTSLLLRYIDAIEFDWEKDNVLDFIQEGLKTGISLPQVLFADTGVREPPRSLDFKTSFRCTTPKGMAHLRLASGQRRGQNALILETMVQTLSEEVPHLPEQFPDWLDAAHEVPSTWFRRLTEGPLYARFQA